MAIENIENGNAEAGAIAQTALSRRRLLELAGVGAILVACGNETPKPVAVSPTPTPTATPTETPTPSAEPARTAAPTAPADIRTEGAGGTETGAEAFVELAERYTSREQAASMHGADSYSRNPRNWFINEFGGATLNPDPRGKVSRVNPNGATVEFWLKVDTREELTLFDAQAFVMHPDAAPQVDIQGGTFWRFGANADAGTMQVHRQLTAREQIEQPGINVICIWPCPPAGALPPAK